MTVRWANESSWALKALPRVLAAMHGKSDVVERGVVVLPVVDWMSIDNLSAGHPH